ncbi:MAG: hypothetical protein JNL08_07810 [Planctomycetes bacterium]|nr:hypothetical protein [Planctomycetota bacterium]
MRNRRTLTIVTALAFALGVLACTTAAPNRVDLHRWWSGFGLVVPHDSFPADCKLCHEGAGWDDLVDDFRFDHGVRTGHALFGAHAEARCLRCHNDRGPVQTFRAQGCAGCHPDVHYGELGKDCEQCHDETSWFVPNARTAHVHSRFPLTGAHMQVACHRCHAGAWVTNFRPTDPDCVSCHYQEAADTTNPPHVGLGWIQLPCDRCHMPTDWRPGVVR